MRTRAGALLLVVGVTVASATDASATPFSYSESLSGDLSQTTVTAFQFDIGDNAISGTTHFLFFSEPDCHYCVDFDSFAFTLPTGTKLTSISVSSTITANNVSKAYAYFSLCGGVGDQNYCGQNALGSQTVNYLDGSLQLVDFAGALPIGAATYTIMSNGIGIAGIDPSLSMGWTADYTWSLSVVPVPEPSTYTLILAGLGVLGFASCRWKASTGRRVRVIDR